jgi:Transposase DDE domain
VAKPSGAMHVESSRRPHVRKDGTEVVYERHLLRRSFRNAQGKPDKETLANLTPLPAEAIAAIRAVLAGKTLVDVAEAFEITRSLPHGHVAAVHAIARQLGFPQILGPAGRERNLALALIVSRVVRPKPKLSTLSWWDDVTLGADLGVADASPGEAYAAMDWLRGRQDAIEAELARRHLGEGGMAMFDLSSSWMEGTHCELAARGYSRDGKKGKTQIEYGLLTDAQARPIAIRVFPGNTADPTAFIEAVEVVRTKFGLSRLTMVGDRGMITSARIDAIRGTGLSWITCLRAPDIAALADDDGPLQMSLFDQQDLAEIAHPDYPNERLVACRNPALAELRAHKRHDLLNATEALLDKLVARVQAGTPTGQDAIGVAVGKVIDKYKMAKHFTIHIEQTSFTYQRNQTRIDAEAALDGLYVIRTNVPADTLDPADVVVAYKNLAGLERDWRNIKTDDLDLRPIHHYRTGRVEAHLLICLLAQYLTWHLRRAWAPLTYTDEQPPTRRNPVAAANRSDAATAKARAKTNPDGEPVRSFRGLLEHLGTLTRNTTVFADRHLDVLTTPTPTQRRAFNLIGAPIPITLT